MLLIKKIYININRITAQPRHLVITMTRTNNPDAHDYNIEIEVGILILFIL